VCLCIDLVFFFFLGGDIALCILYMSMSEYFTFRILVPSVLVHIFVFGRDNLPAQAFFRMISQVISKFRKYTGVILVQVNIYGKFGLHTFTLNQNHDGIFTEFPVHSHQCVGSIDSDMQRFNY
jgi:hypothetical protein